MNTLLNFILHLAILASLGMAVFSAYTLIRKSTSAEAFKLSLSLLVGFLIYMLSKALGLSIPELIFKSLENTSPIKFAVLSAFLSSMLGVAVSMVMVSAMKRSKAVSLRMSLMMFSFIIVAFIDVYAKTYAVDSPLGGINTALIPNMSFILGLVMYNLLYVDK